MSMANIPKSPWPTTHGQRRTDNNGLTDRRRTPDGRSTTDERTGQTDEEEHEEGNTNRRTQRMIIISTVVKGMMHYVMRSTEDTKVLTTIGCSTACLLLPVSRWLSGGLDCMRTCWRDCVLHALVSLTHTLHQSKHAGTRLSLQTVLATNVMLPPESENKRSSDNWRIPPESSPPT